MRWPKVFYRAWFPHAYDSDQDKANRELLGIIAGNLERNYEYKVSISKKGVMKITVPGEEWGEITLPDHVIENLRAVGLDIQEVRYVKDLTSDQFDKLEEAARKWHKTICPIDTLKRGLKIQWWDAPYDSVLEEMPIDDF